MTSVTEWNILLLVKRLHLIPAVRLWGRNNRIKYWFSHRHSSFPAAITETSIGGHFVKICTRSL